MVNIRMVSDEENLFSYLEASGHAGASESGTDIVCAAITILLKTAVLTLKSAEKKSKKLRVKTNTTDKGKLLIKVKAFGENDRSRLRYLMEFLTVGLMAIKTDCSDYLDLRIESIKNW